MTQISDTVVTCALIVATACNAASCTEKRQSSVTVTDLMEDRLTLDRVSMKCNQDADRARSDSNCLNARVAIERLAKDTEPTEAAKRNAGFERSREHLRLAQEAARKQQAANDKIDPYNLPVMPIDSALPATPSVNGSLPLRSGQSKPLP